METIQIDSIWKVKETTDTARYIVTHTPNRGWVRYRTHGVDEKNTKRKVKEFLELFEPAV